MTRKSKHIIKVKIKACKIYNSGNFTSLDIAKPLRITKGTTFEV